MDELRNSKTGVGVLYLHENSKHQTGEVGTRLCTMCKHLISHSSSYVYKFSFICPGILGIYHLLWSVSEKKDHLLNFRTPHSSRVWIKKIWISIVHTQQNLTWEIREKSLKARKTMKPDKSKWKPTLSYISTTHNWENLAR